METSPYGAPTPSDISNPSTHIRLWKVAKILEELGFTTDEILVLSKLGSAGARRVWELYERKGPEIADTLVGSVEGAPDAIVQWVGSIAGKQRFSRCFAFCKRAACRGTCVRRKLRASVDAGQVGEMAEMAEKATRCAGC